MLTLAGGNDVLAVNLHVGVEDLTNVFRVLTVVVPVVVGVVAWRLGVERGRRDRAAEPGPESPDRGVDAPGEPAAGGGVGEAGS
jgi:hypothetical protein